MMLDSITNALNTNLILRTIKNFLIYLDENINRLEKRFEVNCRQ